MRGPGDRRIRPSPPVSWSRGHCVTAADWSRRTRPSRRCRAAGCGSRWPGSAARLGRVLLVGQDRGQVVVGEPAGQRRGAQRLVDGGRAVQLGERDRFGHLRAHPGCAGRGGLDQPCLPRRRRWPGTLPRPGWLRRGVRSPGTRGRRDGRRVVLVADLWSAALPAPWRAISPGRRRR